MAKGQKHDTEKKIQITRELIESGKIQTFAQIFLYVTRTVIAEKLGINYSRLRRLIEDPIDLRYAENYRLSKILKVPPKKISELIHNQLDNHSRVPANQSPIKDGRASSH